MTNYTSRFAIKDEFIGIRPRQQILVFAEKEEKGDIVINVVDLVRQGKLYSVRANASRHFTTLGTECLIWSDAQVGFRVKLLPPDEQVSDLILPCTEPSCLDALRIRQGSYLIGGGTGDGVVHAWKVTICDGKATCDKVLESQSHDGAVTAIAFLDEARLSSGGSDCAIVVSRFLSGGNLTGNIERKLQRKMRCRGLRITGLKGEVEHTLLTKFIRDAESIT